VYDILQLLHVNALFVKIIQKQISSSPIFSWLPNLASPCVFQGLTFTPLLFRLTKNPDHLTFDLLEIL